MSQSFIDELRGEVLAQLKEITIRECPEIYKEIRTPQGYANIERRVITMVCADGITPSAAIGQIESQLEGNG